MNSKKAPKKFLAAADEFSFCFLEYSNCHFFSWCTFSLTKCHGCKIKNIPSFSMVFDMPETNKKTRTIMLSFGYVVKWGSFMILLSSHILPMAKVRIVKTGGWNLSYCQNTLIKSFEASPHLMYLYTWLTQNTSSQPNPDAIQKIDITNLLINEFYKFYSTLWGAGRTSHFGKLV